MNTSPAFETNLNRPFNARWKDLAAFRHVLVIQCVLTLESPLAISVGDHDLDDGLLLRPLEADPISLAPRWPASCVMK